MAEDVAETDAPAPAEGSAPEATEVEPQPEGDGDAWESVGEDSPNRWEGMREGVKLLGEGELAPPLAEEAAAEGAEGDAEAQPTEGEPEGEADAEPAVEDAEQAEPEVEDDGPEHFTAVTADGEPAEVELGEGVEVRFQADGDEHSVDSMEDLVQLAQKGVAFDRKSQEFSETTRELESQLNEVQEARESEREKANRIIKAILTDEEAFAHYAEQLDKLEDPEYQRLVQKARKADKLEEQQEREQEETREEAVERFQAAVKEEIQGNLDDFDYLRPTDEQLVESYFYSLQEQQYEQLLPEYEAAADDRGWDEDEARQHAWAAASQVLTEDNLRAVMESLNEEIQRRFPENGRQGSQSEGPGEGNPSDGPDAAKQEVESHNRHTEEKLEQKKRGPGVRSGGAAPGGSSGLPELERQEGENAFDARMRRMKEMLATARE